MNSYSRAGLFILLFISLFALGDAAPVTSKAQLSTSLSHTTPPSFVVQKSVDFHISEANNLDTTPPTSNSPRDFIVLVRRKSIFTKIKEGFQKLGRGIKHVAQKIGRGIKKVAQKIGSGIKKVAKKIGSGIKKVAKKIGNGIKTAAKKVGHFIKTTGAKIAKVGLKIVATVGKAVGKVIGFIPGVGKVVGKAVEGVSEAANVASDHIHAKIGGKLGKAMRGMDKAEKIEGYIPRELEWDYYAGRSFEESFDTRDLEMFFERDWDDMEPMF